MPKLIENVLIGGRVRLAGEDVSEEDARGIRPEVFVQRAGDKPAPAESPEPPVKKQPANAASSTAKK